MDELILFGSTSDPVLGGDVDNSSIANGFFSNVSITGQSIAGRERTPFEIVRPTNINEGSKSDFDKALDAQIFNVRAIRKAFNSDNNMLKGIYSSSYKDADLGGFIFEGTSIFSSRPTTAGYTLGVVNNRAAIGLVARPGTFSKHNTAYQEGSAALVVGVKPGTSLDAIKSSAEGYNDLSRRIHAPVFVISNGPEVLKFSGKTK